MIQQRRVLEAFHASPITCVALIDDAFDAPAVPGDQAGALLELLQGLAPGSLLPGVELSKPEIDTALASLQASEYDSDEVLVAIRRLFDAFIRSGQDRFDPGGVFAATKANNLAYVRPILDLLRKCDPSLELIPCGSDPSDVDAAAARAQLIFVDFFLNANLSPDGEPSEEQKEAARAASLARVSQLIESRPNPDDTPAIILMSSHEVGERIEKFRLDLSTDKGRVFASRFEFVEKRQFERVASGDIQIQGPALDALLSIIQSFAFGKALHVALLQWKAGADAAIEEVWRDIGAMNLKDFAYLTRFRLALEGTGLAEYLEWFFSECLGDAIGRSVNWAHVAFKLIDKADGPVTQVRGAFDGPTNKVAEMFDHVRVEKPRAQPRRNHRMGDLYITAAVNDVREVRAILTPDCDLMVRKVGDDPKASRLLTVTGVLDKIDAPDASLSDFLLVNGVPHNIRWRLKDIRTVDFDAFPSPGKRGKRLTPAGTLKPLYAYELRNRVLEDLARFGLNVVPAMGANASVQAFVHGSDEDVVIDLAPAARSACSLVFSRGGSDTTQAIFYESAVARFISELVAIDPNTVPEGEIRTALTKVQLGVVAQNTLMAKLSADGVAIGKAVLGIGISSKLIARNAKGRPWCQLIISGEAADLARGALEGNWP